MTDVLILEDELTSLQALSEILTTYSDDIRVHKASSLKEAKDLLDQEIRYGLFLLDVNLSGEDREDIGGILFAREIRERFEYTFTPIVMVTAIGNMEMQAYRELHCYQYIMKPFHREQVEEVVQKVLDAVVGHLLAASILHALLVEPVPDLGHSSSLIVTLERLSHKGCGQRVKLKILFAVDLIADGQGAAVVLGLQGVLRHAPDYLFGQVCGVVFGIALQHTLQNDTLGPVGNDLGGGHHLDPVLFQSGLVAGAVVAVAGKPVQLPDDNHIEQALAAVFNHVLKFRAVIGLGGKGTIYVVAQDGDAVLLSKGSTLSDLTFDTFFPLVVGGIAGVNNCFHSLQPPCFYAFQSRSGDNARNDITAAQTRCSKPHGTTPFAP